MENKKAHSQEYLGEARDYWWNNDYLELLAKRLRLRECSTLLDVGCGKGYMAYKFAPYLRDNANIIGIDLEQKWIDEANAKQKTFPNPNRVRFLFKVGDATKIPLHSCAADITVCQTLLIHQKNPRSVLSEMKRVTKEAGWVVAIEPNNLLNALVGDNLAAESVEDRVKLFEVQLRLEQGKILLGEGNNSLGDLLPEMFKDIGLRDIQVWIADKALSIIPPYDTREKQLRVEEILRWLDQREVFLDYSGQLRYFLAGGGKPKDFEAYWQQNEAKMKRFKAALENETYISAGGGLMYIVAGQK